MGLLPGKKGKKRAEEKGKGEEKRKKDKRKTVLSKWQHVGDETFSLFPDSYSVSILFYYFHPFLCLFISLHVKHLKSYFPKGVKSFDSKWR